MEELPILDCRLDADGLRRQRDRYHRLGLSAAGIERLESLLEIRFAADLDRSLLEETIAVENGCCPFFRFEFEPRERLLRIGVEREDQVPALAALAFALGADE